MTQFAADFIGLAPKKSYDPATALSLAIACDLAYADADTIASVSAGWGYSEFCFINVLKGRDIDTQGFVMSNATDVVCVLRGSDNTADWFANFQAVYDPGPLVKTRAHEGFQDALYPAVIALTNAIDTMHGASKRIWVTGHSLGGALCALYAGMLIENGYKVFGIYTFASPRPGDDEYAQALNKVMGKGPFYRIVNDGDVVPHLPPEPFYSHPGRRVMLSASKKRDTSKRGWTRLREKMFK
ncbi:MAG: lipase family protein, partial [Halieaceae bacterium]|nr:lipase family protein [Halieaceae bacterium]